MKMKHNLLCALLLPMLLACPDKACAKELDADDIDKTYAPYFYIKDSNGQEDSFPLKATEVSANISGSIAEIFVTQTYTNEGTSPIHASYVFPASTKVSVHGMKMKVGDQVVTAKIKEREEAKQEFEEAKKEGKSASLLEQQRPNVFTMDVANLMPGDTANIELHYTELLTSNEGTYQFVFPTVVGPRYTYNTSEPASDDDAWTATPYLHEKETPPGTYQITVNLSAGVPIASVSSSSHDIRVSPPDSMGTDPSSVQVTLSNPQDFAGNRDFILDYKLAGKDIQNGLMLYEGEKENFFLLTTQPPERFEPDEIPPREYIFVLDVSGSMYGFPLDTAKQLIGDLVANLRVSDRFNLIMFSGASHQMSPKSVPATRTNVKKAISLINNAEGGGGTELAEALETAIAIPEFEGYARSIVTISDGYISGEKEIFQLISEQQNSPSFFAFGIGDSVNRYLIEGIAKAGQGESFIVTDPEKAEATAERFRTYIEAPLLTDISVTYDGFDAYDVIPTSIPTLYAQKPMLLFGKYHGKPEGSITITGKRGSQDYKEVISVSDAAPKENNSALQYLWARTRVEQLTDYNTSYEDSEDVKKEVTRLGLDYSMMTSYTSFVAVLETIQNPGGNGKETDQPQPLPLHVSDLAVGGGYTSGSEPGTLFLLFLAAALISFGLAKRRRDT